MTGDLPDWTFAQNTLVTTTGGGSLNPATSNNYDTTNTTTVVLRISGQTVNADVRIKLIWLDQYLVGDELCQQELSGMALPDDGTIVSFETPAYGAGLRIDNQSGHALDFLLFGSSRVVTVPRYLDDTSPSQIYEAAGEFDTGVPIFCGVVDSSDQLFPSNGMTTVIATSNTDGDLQVTFLDSGGTQRTYTLATLSAGVQAMITQALPQCRLGFQFLPSADNGAGDCLVFANAAQL